MRCRLAALFVLSAALLAQTDRPKTFQDEYNVWFKTHPLPNAGTSQDQRQAFDQELANASAAWVQHWPDDPQAWLQRFKSLSKLQSTSNRQLEEVGDMVVKVAKEQPGQRFRFVPFQTEVAEVWSKRNIRLEQCLELTQEAVIEDERAQSDNPSAARHFMPVVAQGLFQTFGLEITIAIRLNKLEIAESAVDQMKQYLNKHPENRIRLEPQYLADVAYVADSEGHKPDALLYYSELLRESSGNTFAETHTHQLWKELGGTDAGFNAWTHTIASLAPTPPVANQGSSPWTEMNKPLTVFHGTDYMGRVWTSKDLKGKTTLVIVWATWCRPCQAELLGFRKSSTI